MEQQNTRFKELRIQNKKTQNEIAPIIDTKQATYGKIENGEVEPGMQKLIKLADYYQVSVDYLIGRNFNNDIGHLSQQEKEFIKAYLMLNQQNKIKIAGYALGLLAGQDENE